MKEIWVGQGNEKFAETLITFVKGGSGEEVKVIIGNRRIQRCPKEPMKREHPQHDRHTTNRRWLFNRRKSVSLRYKEKTSRYHKLLQSLGSSL